MKVHVRRCDVVYVRHWSAEQRELCESTFKTFWRSVWKTWEHRACDKVETKYLQQDKREVDVNACYRKTHIQTLLPQPTKRQDKREVNMNACKTRSSSGKPPRSTLHAATLLEAGFDSDKQGVPEMGVAQNGWFTMENSNKMADLGVPPFPETSMHHIHMIHYDTHLLDMIATWSCCRPKIRMAWWGFWVPATSPGGGRWDTQHGSATCTFFATHSLAYLNCNDIRRSEDVSKLGVALN